MEQVTTRIGAGRSVLERCRDYGRGRLSPAVVLGVLCPLTVLCFVVAVAFAVACFPTSFDFRQRWVSSLASAKQNPMGYFFLSTGLVAVALLLVPLAGYLCRGPHASLATRRVGAMLFWIGLAALLLLGLESTAFPSDGRGRWTHRLLSLVTLSGLTLGFATLTVSRTLAMPGSWRRACLACGVLLAPAVGAALTGVVLHLGPNAPGWTISRQAKQTTPFFRTLAFWEWAAVAGLFAGGYLCAWAVTPRRAALPLPAIAEPRSVEGVGGHPPTRG